MSILGKNRIRFSGGERAFRGLECNAQPQRSSFT